MSVKEPEYKAAAVTLKKKYVSKYVKEIQCEGNQAGKFIFVQLSAKINIFCSVVLLQHLFNCFTSVDEV